MSLNYYLILRYALAALFLLILIYGATMFYRSMFRGKKPWVSIKFKLVIIFLLSTYTPLAAILILGTNWLNERQNVLENKVSKQMLEILNNSDTNFYRKKKEILKTFQKLHKNNEWARKFTDDWETNYDQISKAVGKPRNPHGPSFFNWLEVRDIQSRQLFCSALGETNDRVKEINRVMAKMCFEKYLPDRIDILDSRKISAGEMFERSFLNNPLIGFSHLFESPGRLVKMSFEGSYLYWYWDYFNDPTQKVAYYCVNTRLHYHILSYLDKILLKRYSYENTALKIMAHHPKSKVWFPATASISKKLEQIEPIILGKTKNDIFTINLNHKKYLIAAFIGINLKDILMYCIYPYEKISEQIKSLETPLYASILLLLLISAFTGLLITDAFLRPVEELAGGVRALQKRNVSYRVKISNNDELGELGATFNHIMEEAKEMMLAGAIQQCLIPKIIPQIKNYDLAMYNQMTTDLGGDYCDVFKLDDNSYLIALGDVTGHGVSASILTTMVKAIIHRYSRKPTDIETLTKELSVMIFNLVHRKKLMTFCAAILDTESHTLTVTNAGHPYPYICSADGTHRTIEHECLPLVLCQD